MGYDTDAVPVVPQYLERKRANPPWSRIHKLPLRVPGRFN
jgi:hypothetical protein